MCSDHASITSLMFATMYANQARWPDAVPSVNWTRSPPISLICCSPRASRAARSVSYSVWYWARVSAVELGSLPINAQRTLASPLVCTRSWRMSANRPIHRVGFVFAYVVDW